MTRKKTLELARRRMHNQALAGTRLEHPEDAVRLLGAVQAQDYAGAKWSLGLRCDGATDAGIERALDAGSILRTHALRPTWHLLLPDELRWIQELTGPRVRALSGYYFRQQDLDVTVLRKARRVIAKELEGGVHRTRKELGVVLGKKGIEAEGVRLAFIMMDAELDALVCNGRRRGREHTYALVSERAPEAPAVPRDQALGELVRRFFVSHGPATVADLKWWSSLRVGEIREGIEIAGDELAEETVDGVTYWSGRDDAGIPSPPRGARLLQGFDEYVVAYADTKHVFDVRGVRAAVSDIRALSSGAVIVESQLRGHWKRKVLKESVVVEAVLYGAPSGAERKSLDEAADELGSFLGLGASLEVTVV